MRGTNESKRVIFKVDFTSFIQTLVPTPGCL